MQSRLVNTVHRPIVVDSKLGQSAFGRLNFSVVILGMLGLVTVLSVVTSGCASGKQLKAEALYVGSTLDRIREAAYRCAERELAMAESNLDFGNYELDRGSYLEATAHLEIAHTNADAAAAIVDVRPECWPDFVADSDGDGILDNDDLCPLDPEDFDDFEDEDGCPEDDNDLDGLYDFEDQCPNDPEDFDLFEDEDGCPDLDNDGDGVLDYDDECPNDPEDFDGDQDEDGCPEDDPEPELEFTVIHDDRIEITEQIHFAYDSSDILPDSYPILDEIVSILLSHPRMELRIEGHTDSSGSARYNLRLSDERAGSVRSYLIRAGIGASRTVSVGHGEESPIETNETADGRAANRRVEFHIVAQ